MSTNTSTETIETVESTETKQVSVRLPKELWVAMQHARFEADQSNSDFIVALVKQALDPKA